MPTVKAGQLSEKLNAISFCAGAGGDRKAARIDTNVADVADIAHTRRR